jgi:cystathionine beta-lyase/cystathionine gamma-synthase
MTFETMAIWIGQAADQSAETTIVPIYQTSTYTREEVNKHKPDRAIMLMCLRIFMAEHIDDLIDDLRNALN